MSNAALFPRSQFASLHYVVTNRLIGTATIADILILAICALALTVLARAALSFGYVRRNARHIAAVALLAAAGLLWWPLLAPDRAAVVVADRPHVIVIGVDSLRKDLVRRAKVLTFAPNLRSFQATATAFPDAVTPLGRTFASWATILSGRHPVHSGARDALMPPSLLNVSPTLADRLRAAGYGTAYAIDDARYSNIDEAFGFDRVVSPPIGAADFIVGKLADLPLSNLLANTSVGAWLLPNVYGNRAVAALYRPNTFVEWLDRSVDFDRPTFLAVHLTLAHWPYYWADPAPNEIDIGTLQPYEYLRSVTAVDRQFGQLMGKLQRRGVLRNAIVIVLSDHGEALGLEEDDMIDRDTAQRLFGSSVVTSHGTSVFSPSQYQVLLGIRRFDGSAPVQGHASAAPASLEDIAPTVLAMLDLPVDPHDFDGVSLAQELTAGNSPDLRSRIRFTETGLTTSALSAGNLSEAANLREGAQYFNIDERGRVVLNFRRLPDLIARKQHAAFDGEWMLAAIPQRDTAYQQYIFVRRAGGKPEIVTNAPDAVRDPRFVALWQALQWRFGKEVQPAVE